ncbi:MAG TPA: enoyl-CoA hydratase/isomerase family protein [Nocardioidaceae bacterium]|nr:enoyl-CoA hydratase/isomerase family protein [Nocardioidaceae bacterium]
MSPDQERVVVEHHGLTDGCVAALLRLNRPEDLNPLDWDTVRALDERLAEADQDDTVRVILVTGAGRAFSAGGDLKAYQRLQRDRLAFPAFLADLHRTFAGIRTMRTPVVALVNGVAAAGGLELIASCDFGYAAASARIGDAHVRFGQMGGGGALTLLPRLLSPARARELVFSGRYLTAEEACSWGLVNRVVPDDELLEAGLELGREVAGASALAVANAKFVMNSAWADGTGVDAALRLERERTSYYCVTSDDAQAGLAAFAEKRPPRFGGR